METESISKEYVHIDDWTYTVLGMSLPERYIFSIIRSFTMAPNVWFYGSLNYLHKRSGLSTVGVQRILTRLVEQNFILKNKTDNFHVTYRCNHEYINELLQYNPPQWYGDVECVTYSCDENLLIQGLEDSQQEINPINPGLTNLLTQGYTSKPKVNNPLNPGLNNTKINNKVNTKNVNNKEYVSQSKRSPWDTINLSSTKNSSNDNNVDTFREDESINEMRESAATRNTSQLSTKNKYIQKELTTPKVSVASIGEKFNELDDKLAKIKRMNKENKPTKTATKEQRRLKDVFNIIDRTQLPEQVKEKFKTYCEDYQTKYGLMTNGNIEGKIKFITDNYISEQDQLQYLSSAIDGTWKSFKTQEQFNQDYGIKPKTDFKHIPGNTQQRTQDPNEKLDLDISDEVF